MAAAIVTDAERAAVRARIFTHLAGLVMGPTVAALWERGALERLTSPPGPVPFGDILDRTHANPGYLRIALRLLASCGWLIERKSTLVGSIEAATSLKAISFSPSINVNCRRSRTSAVPWLYTVRATPGEAASADGVGVGATVPNPLQATDKTSKGAARSGSLRRWVESQVLITSSARQVYGRDADTRPTVPHGGTFRKST